MKRWLLTAMLLMLCLVLGGCSGTRPENMQSVCTADVNRQGEQLRQLMQVYQGEFVDSRHEGYRKLDKLLQLKLRYADFRNPERCVFLFDSHILEGGVTLCYCPEDMYVIDNAHVVTAQTDTLRLEGLGIDGSGYTLCVRVCENWFYVESLLPT